MSREIIETRITELLQDAAEGKRAWLDYCQKTNRAFKSQNTVSFDSARYDILTRINDSTKALMRVLHLIKKSAFDSPHLATQADWLLSQSLDEYGHGKTTNIWEMRFFAMEHWYVAIPFFEHKNKVKVML